jgi:hypothetical protein
MVHIGPFDIASYEHKLDEMALSSRMMQKRLVKQRTFFKLNTSLVASMVCVGLA